MKARARKYFSLSGLYPNRRPMDRAYGPKHGRFRAHQTHPPWEVGTDHLLLGVSRGGEGRLLCSPKLPTCFLSPSFALQTVL